MLVVYYEKRRGWAVLRNDDAITLPAADMRIGETHFEAAVFAWYNETKLRESMDRFVVLAVEDGVTRSKVRTTVVERVWVVGIQSPTAVTPWQGDWLTEHDLDSTNLELIHPTRAENWLRIAAAKHTGPERVGHGNSNPEQDPIYDDMHAGVPPQLRSHPREAEDPTRFGPFLFPHEEYQRLRTKENVDEVCAITGIDDARERYGSSVYDSLRELVYTHWILFDDENLRAVRGVAVDINTEGARPIAVPPHRLGNNPEKVQAAHDLVNGMVRDGTLAPVVSDWAFPAVIVPKPKGGWRLCCDLRKLNAIMRHDHYEPPSIADCMAFTAGKPFRSAFDLKSGFHQLMLTARARRVLTIVLPFGTYSYQRLPMGYINATAEFQRVVNRNLGGLTWKICMIMVDDLMVASPTLEEHIDHLRQVFERLACKGHTLSAKKTNFLREELEYLGHVCTPNGLRIPDRTVVSVREMPYPLDSDGTVNVT
ncbi:MAG: reverse transcriptase family protein, partial [Actinomycetota bacterium]|nr:reverse transcriptase family protein [Actinomycetota bacterium]